LTMLVCESSRSGHPRTHTGRAAKSTILARPLVLHSLPHRYPGALSEMHPLRGHENRLAFGVEARCGSEHRRLSAHGD
jgi:hypothetical protein